MGFRVIGSFWVDLLSFWYHFAVILNEFGSTIIWAIQIWVSFTVVKNAKIPNRNLAIEMCYILNLLSWNSLNIHCISVVKQFNWWLTKATMVKSIMMPPLKRRARWSWSASGSLYWQQIGRINDPAISDNKLRNPTLPPV